MIPKECKRLAEVDFPIGTVSAHAVKENSVRRGLPKALHLWWARRPLGSSRAILLSLLLPDPSDTACPKDFAAKARAALSLLPGGRGAASSEPAELRDALLQFISDFASWDLATNANYVEAARSLVRAVYGDDKPLVVDPFAGGGAIPLEALRIGCDAFASDINPVAAMILKMTLEEGPRYSADDVRDFVSLGNRVTDEVTRFVGKFFASDGQELPAIVLWAKTVRCESPHCGAEIPLTKSFWLLEGRGVKKALRYSVDKKVQPPRIVFEIFEPKNENAVPRASVSHARASCLCCGTTLSPDSVRRQLREQKGGVDPVFDTSGRRVGGARILAVVTVDKSTNSRRFRLPTEHDYEVFFNAARELDQRYSQRSFFGLPAIPNEKLERVPVPFGVINVWVYGVSSWSQLFSLRQKLVLLTLVDRIGISLANASERKAARLLVLAFSHFLRSCNGNARRRPDSSAAPAFGMQALPFNWSFPETVPWGSRSETFAGAVSAVADVFSGGMLTVPTNAIVMQADALHAQVPDNSAAVWFTDPPYYDAIPYSYLSDFFYVWLRRILGGTDSALFASELTPKLEELVSYTFSREAGEEPRQRYERMLGVAFEEGKRGLRDDGVGAIVFAHKTTEGWEAFLSALVAAGWVITASWPVSTEGRNRLRARNASALASSIHMVVRPRVRDDVGDWANVLRELPSRVDEWMERLQGEGIRGADLVFACIGPALEIFSRYVKVETADGREVTLGEYLAKVWEVVGRSALAQVLGTAEAKARNGAAGAVEEDARLTALFLWTIQSTNGAAAEENGPEEEEASEDDDEDEDGDARSGGKPKGFTLVFDVVRRFAQPLGIELPKWEGRVIETKKGVVRLLPIAERAKQLFGDDGAQAVATRLEREALMPNPLQGILFPDLQSGTPAKRGRGKRGGGAVAEESLAGVRQATTLDRVHAAMLLQAGGRTNALRALLKSEQERSPDFLRLANALSALYPKGSEEKRLLDAMLLATSR